MKDEQTINEEHTIGIAGHPMKGQQISFSISETGEEIIKISEEGFFYMGEKVEDVHNVYERFNDWLTLSETIRNKSKTEELDGND